MQSNNLLVWLLVGLVAGFLGGLVTGGTGGLVGALVAGVLGSLVGGYIFQALKIDLKIGSPLVTQIVVSTVGAIIVIILARLII